MKIETPNAPHADVSQTEEARRLEQAKTAGWRRWGPYVSARQWGTVREDYSADGTAWSYLSHEHARSRAYRWGEDAIGGFSDDEQRLCLAPAFWNGKDAILKERLFGLSNAEGNHGEDVKELYYYLDGTPTHSYMRMLYKYPQSPFPYEELLRVNGERGLEDPEYELIETGIFDERRYFDIEIEYAKAGPDDILMRISAHNRGPDKAVLHILPQLWARNTWAWQPDARKPQLAAEGGEWVAVDCEGLPAMVLHCAGAAQLLFCDNETNRRRLYGLENNGYCKDAVNDWLVSADAGAVNPAGIGTKVAAHYPFEIAAGGTACVRVRLSTGGAAGGDAAFDAVFAARRAEADAFYAALQEDIAGADARLVQRQAFAGLLWCKQYYGYDVRQWLKGDPGQPTPPEARWHGRNNDWQQLTLADVISMPDDWEYPWFAAWDLAFHSVSLTLIDPAFAKAQLVLLTQARSQHPSGQLPAYEWDFDAVNPPVHAWAAMQIYEMDRRRSGVGDTAFLERMFHKLMLNFTWWVNREDALGRNIFQGGFLGLDNIALFDRSATMSDGRRLDQSDGTAWMAMFSLNLMRIALELALADHVYEDLATKFFEHFLYIAHAMHGSRDHADTGLWDDEDGFYYDVLHDADGQGQPVRVRSLVGLIPLLAVEVLHQDFLTGLPDFTARLEWFLKHRADLSLLVSHWGEKNKFELRMLSLMRRNRMNRVLSRMLDESAFLSEHGIRSISKEHRAHPFTFEQDGKTLTIGYAPGDSTTRLYGGNSNWRGPVWMPINYLLIDALNKFDAFYGPAYRVEYPTGSGEFMRLKDIALRLSRRLSGLFLKDGEGRRPLFGDSRLQQDDPFFQDLLIFPEYFHGDTGKGLGASHQTGWTALVALLLQPQFQFAAHEATPAAARSHDTSGGGEAA